MPSNRKLSIGWATGRSTKLILSGTPVSNSPLDLWSQYRFLNPFVFGTSYFQFEKRHAIMGGPPINGKQRKLVGYRDLDGIMDRAYSIASRATKADALDLPREDLRTPPGAALRGGDARLPGR